MEESPAASSVLEFIKKNILFVGLIAFGVLLSAFGAIQYFTQSSTAELEFIEAEASDVKGVTIESKVKVDVSGSVENPGVYTLEPGSRVADALAKAGGMTKGADSEYVAKRLNLAQKVPDGAKIYIPAVGETTTNTTVSSSNLMTDTSISTDTSSALVNINSASESQLDTLPKVGPVTAKKIIDGRPYGSIEDLVIKKVLTQKTFEGLRDMITAE